MHMRPSKNMCSSAAPSSSSQHVREAIVGALASKGGGMYGDTGFITVDETPEEHLICFYVAITLCCICACAHTLEASRVSSSPVSRSTVMRALRRDETKAPGGKEGGSRGRRGADGETDTRHKRTYTGTHAGMRATHAAESGEVFGDSRVTAG